jgi:ubiquinone/menaquinone biosynthesis C-methylase UbiE
MTNMSRQNKAMELAQAQKIIHNTAFYWNRGTRAGIQGSLRRAHWTLSAADMVPGKRVLEVGCGMGFYTEIFAGSGAQIHGIDLSPGFIKKAVQRLGNSADLKSCDIEDLPYPDNYFDAIAGIRVLHHLDMERAFKEISRTLKPGGIIAFCEPNMLNPQLMIQKNIPWIKKLMGDTPDETAFFKQHLKRFLQHQGFQDISIEPFDFLHPWVPAPLTDAVDKLGRRLEQTPIIREIAGSLKIRAVNNKKGNNK